MKTVSKKNQKNKKAVKLNKNKLFTTDILKLYYKKTNYLKKKEEIKTSLKNFKNYFFLYPTTNNANITTITTIKNIK